MVIKNKKKISDKTKIRKLQKELKYTNELLQSSNAEVTRLSDTIKNIVTERHSAPAPVPDPQNGSNFELVTRNERITFLEREIALAISMNPKLDPAKNKVLQDALTPPISGQAS